MSYLAHLLRLMNYMRNGYSVNVDRTVLAATTICKQIMLR